eukprot:833926-Prorocentrum_minimum.AAC.1
MSSGWVYSPSLTGRPGIPGQVGRGPPRGDSAGVPPGAGERLGSPLGAPLALDGRGGAPPNGGARLCGRSLPAAGHRGGRIAPVPRSDRPRRPAVHGRIGTQMTVTSRIETNELVPRRLYSVD